MALARVRIAIFIVVVLVVAVVTTVAVAVTPLLRRLGRLLQPLAFRLRNNNNTLDSETVAWGCQNQRAGVPPREPETRRASDRRTSHNRDSTALRADTMTIRDCLLSKQNTTRSAPASSRCAA